MRLLKKGYSFVLVALLGLPSMVIAQGGGLKTPQQPQGVAGGGLPTTLTGVILHYINIFLGVIGIIAVLFIIYGGFRYITSAGNEETAESGKKTLQNAIIGLVIVIFSWVIVRVVITTFALGVV